MKGNIPVASMQTLGEVYSSSMARTSFTLVMLAIAGAMALVLSLIGIYRVISYAYRSARAKSAFAWRSERKRANCAGCSCAPLWR